MRPCGHARFTWLVRGRARNQAHALSTLLLLLHLASLALRPCSEISPSTTPVSFCLHLNMLQVPLRLPSPPALNMLQLPLHLPSPPVLLVSVPHISPLQSPSQKAESHRDFSLSVNPYLLLTIKHSECCFPISFKSPPRLHCHTSEPHSSNTHHHSSLLATVPKPSVLL